MANKRMFSVEIVCTDVFMEMPVTAQALYFQLGMQADDDGFVSNSRAIMRMINASSDDLDVLIKNKYVLLVEDGLIVIRHWNVNNSIRKDRYIETIYKKHKKKLFLIDGVYELDGNQNDNQNGNQNGNQNDNQNGNQNGNQNDNQNDNQNGNQNDNQNDNPDKYSIDKYSIDKSSIYTSCPEAKVAPASPLVISFVLNDGSMYDVTEEEVKKYQELYPGVDVMQELRKIVGWCDGNPKNRKTRNGAKRFLNGWMARAQDSSTKTTKKSEPDSKNRFNNFEQRSYDFNTLERQLLGITDV